MLNRVSVWLDDLAPEGGAFAHALEWATRLGLPLHGIVLASQQTPSEVRTLQACAESCRRQRVSWQGSVWQGLPDLGVQNFVKGGGLCVYGQALPGTRREELLSWSLRNQAAAALVCTTAWSPLGRILLLNQGHDPESSFFAVTARICRAFRAVPVVLTVAHSEADARSRQQLAQQALAAQQVTGDFDFVVGRDLRAAVALEAQCRHCSHVFMERRTSSPWWRWLRGDPIHRLLGLANPLTFLAVPALPVPDATRQLETTTGAADRLRRGSAAPISASGANSATPNA